jgi:hypothetical protein
MQSEKVVSVISELIFGKKRDRAHMLESPRSSRGGHWPLVKRCSCPLWAA